MDFELPDISNFRDMSDLFYIFFAILTIDIIVLFLARYYKVGGKYLNEWYDQFNLLAVIADVMIIFIGFLITRYIYTYYLFERYEWSPIYFMILLVVVQLLHDLVFYVGIIKPIPTGHNEMLDIFKKYADDLGGVILGGDAMLMITSALVAMVYKLMPLHAFVSVSSIFVYVLPYILFTRNPYILEEAKKKDDLQKQKNQNPNKIDAYGRLI